MEKMKKKYIFSLMIILALTLLLSTSCGYGTAYSYSPQDGLKVTGIEDRALAYMKKNYGDIFQFHSSEGYAMTGGEPYGPNWFRIPMLVNGHPYDDIQVLGYMPARDLKGIWLPSKETGKILGTDYPYYLFGNKAGPEWAKILGKVFPQMGYLPPDWTFTTKEFLGDPPDYTRQRYGDSTWKMIDGLTKGSTLTEFMNKSPIYGILVLPVKGEIPTVPVPPNSDYYGIPSRGVLPSDPKLPTVPELATVKAKYDVDLQVVYVTQDYFDELSKGGNPAEQLAKKYGYKNDKDPVVYAARFPIMFPYALLALTNSRHSDTGPVTFADSRILATFTYSTANGVDDVTYDYWYPENLLE